MLMNLTRGDGVSESHWLRLGCSTMRAAGFPLQVKVPVCVPDNAASLTQISHLEGFGFLYKSVSKVFFKFLFLNP